MKFNLKTILSVAGIIGGALLGVAAVKRASTLEALALPDDCPDDDKEEAEEKDEEVETTGSEKDEEG